MKKTLVTPSLVMLLFVAAVPVYGRGPKLASNLCRQNPEAVANNVRPGEGDLAPASERSYARAWQVMSMHGVWYTPKIYFLFYADADLLAYLTGISDLVVLPVYSPSPVHFRDGDVVFVSTGLILESRSEAELFEAIMREGDARSFRETQPALALCKRNSRSESPSITKPCGCNCGVAKSSVFN